jgi:transglutaminase-like putative cysteine protease
MISNPLLACRFVVLISLIGNGAALGQAAAARADQASDDEIKSRSFRFNYRFRVKNIEPSADGEDLVRVWLPCPSASDEQDVERLGAKAPAELSDHVERQFGNRILYFEMPAPASGAFDVDVPYQITRREVLRGRVRPVAKPAELSPRERTLFLRADSLVPTSGKAMKLLEDKELPKTELAAARTLYDLVDKHVVYKKEGAGWGRGDTNWVCDSGYGNCTDFHSLFMTLARSQGLPCRFEIGFSIPTDKTSGPIAGYHCWAWFYTAERGWTPVDISEADKAPSMKEYYFGNLTADRVTFSIGRDLKLAPASASSALNFFIYPHIEVGGKVLPKENVELRFAFEE